MRVINWASPEQLFEELNRTGEYAVLRNWEEYFDDLFMPGHGDIDLLCSRKDRRRIIKATGAFRRTNIFNQWNFWVVISDRLVKFDLRVEGDGYYDIKWERDMLSSRIFDKRGFYRLSDEQYFFSLIYHAAYQKREFAQDYVERLTAMLNGSADDSGRGTDEDSREGTECTDRNSLKEKLEKYMSENGYEYSFVFNPSVYLNLDGVPENRIQKRPTEVANMYTRKSVRLARKWGGTAEPAPDRNQKEVVHILKEMLEAYMKERKYRYTVCYDTGVNLNMQEVSRDEIYQSIQVHLYRSAKTNAKRLLKVKENAEMK